MATIAEFAARHGDGTLEDEFASDELAAELHVTPLSAAAQMDYSSQVAGRLPASFAAMGAGQVHPVHVRIVEDETRVLTDADAAKADAVLAGAAPGMTFGQLRAAAHKLVLQLDPEAARKRKEAARGDATCAGSGKPPATPGWSPASSPPTKFSCPFGPDSRTEFRQR